MSGKSTKVSYLYRDADNYKVHNEVVLAGEISEEQIEEIIASLNLGEYFIPGMVGLPAERFSTYDPEADHDWFELGYESFESTEQRPTVPMSVEELVDAFRSIRGDWGDGHDGDCSQNCESCPVVRECIRKDGEED